MRRPFHVSIRHQEGLIFPIERHESSGHIDKSHRNDMGIPD
jgi:hypothetical protein